MNNRYNKDLEYIKEEGYFNNGAVSARSIKSRKVIVLDNGFIVRRSCELESY